MTLTLETQDLTIRFGGHVAVNCVSCTFRPGELTAIVGPNGAGKTSLLRLCMGLTAPTRGRVTWGGRANAVPTRRAIVFQRPVMLRRSAGANLDFALAQAGVPRRERAARTASLLDRVGLADLAERPARRLSSGEQQRLALARALARDPELLLLDEPTANLDPAATRSVEDIVVRAARSGIKVVMATHDLGQVRRVAGDVVFLLHGAIREQRPVADFLDRPSTPEAAAFVRGDLVI